jgi:hypothetical protein
VLKHRIRLGLVLYGRATWGCRRWRLNREDAGNNGSTRIGRKSGHVAAWWRFELVSVVQGGERRGVRDRKVEGDSEGR